MLAEAGRNDRVDAIVVESTHTTAANAAQVRLDQAGYPLAVPGSWAIMFGSLLRTGEDVSSADPVQAVERLDGRPLLVIHAGADATISANDDEELAAAAEGRRNADRASGLHRCRPRAGDRGVPRGVRCTGARLPERALAPAS